MTGPAKQVFNGKRKGEGIPLVLATRNRKKRIEIRELLSDLPFQVLSLEDFPNVPDVIENGKTFEENAEKKAVAVAKATGCLALADDSGLCVDALQGEPGVHSARFAGPAKDDVQNCLKLLQYLKDIEPDRRTAHFRCAVCIASPDGVIETVVGTCDGLITDSLIGQNGFGYDPVFFYPPLGRTFAQLDRAVKNRVSHRAKALRQAKEVLSQWFKKTQKEK